MRRTVVLLHSPLVGPLTWQAVARRLRANGRDVIVPDLSDAVRAGPPHEPALVSAVADAVGDGPFVLVGHSAVGPLLPIIGDRIEAEALVYVDARLAHRRRPELDDLARDGMLPPWNEWFPAAELAAILPDPAMRSAFVSELRPVPLSLYDPPAADRPAWTGTAGYLLLSEAYRPIAEQAAAAGQTVVEALDHHLAMLTAPAAVTAVLERFL
jgi:pimeloyl-ACP methyl ester carboxylesterase